MDLKDLSGCRIDRNQHFMQNLFASWTAFDELLEILAPFVQLFVLGSVSDIYFDFCSWLGVVGLNRLLLLSIMIIKIHLVFFIENIS